MSNERLRLLAASLLLLGGAAKAHAQDRLESLGLVRSTMPWTQVRSADFDGDGRADLLTVGAAGGIQAWTWHPESGLVARGEASRLPYPKRSLLAVADFDLGHPGEELVVLDPKGLFLWAPNEMGVLEASESPLARRARFRLRTDSPRFADYIRDLDGNGLPDVVLPTGWSCEIWTQEPGASPPRVRRQASIPVELDIEESFGAMHGDELLSDNLSASYEVPRLDIRDLNGNGRADLLVESGRTRAFHLQKQDGTIPADPDMVLDLNLFRDTTPEGGVRLGRTFQGARESQVKMRDLNGDGRLDYVIAHLRKIWVFHGAEEGPQFTDPTQILRVAEDVSWLQVVQLDDDEYPDLLLTKVEVPSAAALLRGFVSELAIGIRVLDYPGNAEGRFATLPRRTRDLVLRLPPLLDLIKDFTRYFRRFEEQASRSRISAEGDFDGDQIPDLALVTEDGTALELWLHVDNPLPNRERSDALLRRIFFDDANPEWTIDRLLTLFGDFVASRALELTRGRSPDLRFTLRPVDRYTAPRLRITPLDDQPGDELILVYREIDTEGDTLFEVLGLR